MTSTSSASAASAAVIETPIHRLQISLKKRVDEETERFVENFGGIVHASKIKDIKKPRLQRDNLQIELYVENMILSGESLAQLVYDLKHIVLLSDFRSMHEELKDQQEKLKKVRQTTEEAVSSINAEIGELIDQLEAEYYYSPPLIFPRHP